MSDMARSQSEPEYAEVWLPIPDYEGLYEVSDAGQVRAVKPYRSSDGILHGDVDRYGYRRVLLSKNGVKKRHKVHRLVCRTFNGEAPAGTECGHRNGKCGDNQAANLGWVTRSENILDTIKHGTYVRPPPGKGNRSSKLSEVQVAAIRDGAACGVSERQLAKKFKVSHGHVHKIVAGQRRTMVDNHG